MNTAFRGDQQRIAALRRADSLQARYPAHIERRYRNRLLTSVRAVGRLTRERIAGILRIYGSDIDDRARQDSEAMIVRAITREITGIRIAAEGLWTDRDITDYAEEIAGQVNLFETRQTARQWKAVMGVDPIFGDQLTQSIVREFSIQNLRLIKNMPDEYLRQVQNELVQAVREGQRAEVFQDLIQERLKVAESRARLIARDQIGSVAGAITEVRQRELGVRRYIWSTSQDERVVGDPNGFYPEATDPDKHGDHYAREGKIFTWDHVHEDGHPGRPIQCRCTAIPVVEDLI